MPNNINTQTSQSSKLENFFSALRAKRESLIEFMTLYEAPLAPRFNVFDFIRPNELKLSEIIAFLLNPTAKHGQGDVFLRIFLKAIGKEELCNATDRVTCILEQLTKTIENDQRRIDIELKVGDFGIGFENKPWAGDQLKQLTDYAKDLGNRYGERFLLVYLSGDGHSPSEDSIGEEERKELERNGHIEVLSYRKFIECVNGFKVNCQSDRVRHFLQDFEDYLNREFEGVTNMYEKDMVINYALRDPENLCLALTIGDLTGEIKTELLKRFKDILEANCPEGLELRWEIEDYRKKEQGFGFKNKTWKNYLIYFQFEGTWGNGLFYGVSKESENLPDVAGLHDEDKLGKGESSSWWPWYQYFENPYYDWRYSHEPWIELCKEKEGERGGDLAKIIIEKVRWIAKVLDQIPNL